MIVGRCCRSSCAPTAHALGTRLARAAVAFAVRIHVMQDTPESTPSISQPTVPPVGSDASQAP
jgi:hypothetical protein